MDKFIKILRIILVLFIFTWIIIWYSPRAAKKLRNSRNLIERSVFSLSAAPGKVKRYIKTFTDDEHMEKSIEPSDDLYELGKLPDNSYLDETHYLLHYRYLGEKTGAVLLQNIKNGEIAWTWEISLSDIMKDFMILEKELDKKYMKGIITIDYASFFAKSIQALRIRSPIISTDFSLIFHSGIGHVYKIDKNSKLMWKSKKIAHHAIELDSQGNIWTCSIDIDNKIANKNSFRDDAILCLYPNGKEKHFLSLTQTFSNNGLFDKFVAHSLIFELWYGFDPYHLNDILPVNSDGVYWKKGDIFLSLCVQNMIALYRPSTDSIIWQQKGPWVFQHDINIINDSVISVFNNNYSFLDSVKANSNIAYFNFANGQTSYFAEDLFSSRTEGRQTRTVNNDLIIEETNNSTYLVFDSTGVLKCKFYIPYYSDSSKAQYPLWARVYIKKDKQFIKQ